MKEQPEALRLADALMTLFPSREDGERAAAKLRWLHASCEDYAQHKQRQDQRVLALTAQRDALLEALKRMASIIDKMGDMPDGFIHPSPWQTLKCEEALTQARAAIKSVEGEKT